MQGFGQASGSFPIDLVLFAMIAAFLVLRLRGILGKRTGFEGAPSAGVRPVAREATATIDGRAEPVPAAPTRSLPDPASDTGRALADMAAIDKRFDPAQFLTGAEAAFRVIVTAFGAGDRVRLHPLLTDETYAAFETAITAREDAKHTQRTEVRDIVEATITAASLAGKVASITVHFVSQQVNLTTGTDGEPITGTDAVTEIADLWTFTRDLSQQDLAWRLAAAHSV